MLTGGCCAALTARDLFHLITTSSCFHQNLFTPSLPNATRTRTRRRASRAHHLAAPAASIAAARSTPAAPWHAPMFLSAWSHAPPLARLLARLPTAHPANTAQAQLHAAQQAVRRAVLPAWRRHGRVVTAQVVAFSTRALHHARTRSFSTRTQGRCAQRACAQRGQQRTRTCGRCDATRQPCARRLLLLAALCAQHGRAAARSACRGAWWRAPAPGCGLARPEQPAKQQPICSSTRLLLPLDGLRRHPCWHLAFIPTGMYPDPSAPGSQPRLGGTSTVHRNGTGSPRDARFFALRASFAPSRTLPNTRHAARRRRQQGSAADVSTRAPAGAGRCARALLQPS
jgi:hypothetical protein